MARPFDFIDFTPEEMQAKIEKYFTDTPDEELTVTGLALALKVDRHTLLNYETYAKERIDKNVLPEIITLIKQAKMRVHNAYERDGRKKGGAFNIFALKNFDWTDQQKIDHTTGGEKISGFNYIIPSKNGGQHKTDDEATSSVGEAE
jgi:hypothetical protein